MTYRSPRSWAERAYPWLDAGCGTGALTETVLEHAAPAAVTGVDPTESFLELARQRLPGAKFEVRSATAR